MNNSRPASRIAIVIAMVLVAVFSVVHFSPSLGAVSTPSAGITLTNMQGTWTATLSGVNGCGVATLVITFTLDATGNGTQTSTQTHTAGCGDSTTSGQAAQIQSLDSDGNGFIALGCGTGCGYGFYMQVAKNREIFNMGPQMVSGNYLAGVAIRNPK
jgi:hypothetical protein